MLRCYPVAQSVSIAYSCHVPEAFEPQSAPGAATAAACRTAPCGSTAAACRKRLCETLQPKFADSGLPHSSCHLHNHALLYNQTNLQMLRSTCHCATLHVQGVGNDMVTGPTGPLAHIDLAARVTALNNLLRSSKVALFKQGTQLLYKAAQPQDNR